VTEPDDMLPLPKRVAYRKQSEYYAREVGGAGKLHQYNGDNGGGIPQSTQQYNSSPYQNIMSGSTGVGIERNFTFHSPTNNQ